MATIRIVDLKVRAIIGTHPWERGNKQEIIINITIDYDASKAAKNDQIKDALDYEQIANKVVKEAQHSRCHLLEKLAARLLSIVLADKRVALAVVRIDKPHALESAKFVSYEAFGKNS